MSELQQWIDQLYESAKAGRWDAVLSEWRKTPVLARRCSRYRKPTSGWSFLHQAAYFGNENACRELIGLGAAVGVLSVDGKSAAMVADEKGHREISALLLRADEDQDSLWVSPRDPDIGPSSSLWAEAVEMRASSDALIAYAGGIVRIPAGGRYFVDSFGRTLVGWHGTYDPPCGMDGESMLGIAR